MDFLDWLVPDEPRSCGQSSERIEQIGGKIFLKGKEVTGKLEYHKGLEGWNWTSARKTERRKAL